MPAGSRSLIGWQRPKSDTMYDIPDVRLLDTPDGPVANNTTGFTVVINGEPQIVLQPIQPPLCRPHLRRTHPAAGRRAPSRRPPRR